MAENNLLKICYKLCFINTKIVLEYDIILLKYNKINYIDSIDNEEVSI